MQTRSLENPAIPVSATELSAMLGYGPTRSGVQIDERSALTFVPVFAAIRILAEAIGMLPTAVFQGDEDEGDMERATSHPVYRLMRYEPNPEMTAIAFKETMMGHLVGWGNAYARIITDGANRPRRIIPLMPDRTHPERYAGQLRYTCGTDKFAPEEIIHIPGLGFNGIKGYSPIAMQREAVAMGKAQEIFGATFYGNGANMDAVITYPNSLSPEAINRLRESIMAHYANPGNAHKPLILEEGATYNRISISPKDAEFIEGKRFSVSDIARIFRIPLHMLAEIMEGTRGTVEQAGIEFLNYTLIPYIEKFEQEFNRKLFPDSSDYFVRFDTSRFTRADATARQALYANGRQWGWLSQNDIRRMEGLPPIEGGDVYLSPVNMIPADMLKNGLGYGQPIKPGAQPPKPPEEPEDDPVDVDEKDDDDAERSRVAAAIAPVLADVIARMLRKELNAASRASFDGEKFYPDHRRQFVDALRPAVRALVSICDPNIDAAKFDSHLQSEAERSSAGITPIEIGNAADRRAAALITEIMKSVRGTP